ncbi:MAG TPA: nucleotidyltransferase family protein [Anaerolineales bacterium]|nr:nucleotidyltransferase family protein [Anaerolineales bacterium]
MPFKTDASEPNLQIGAVVLAAGESRRMGEPKMSLPWGNTTVIARVCEVLLSSGLTEIWVVTGGGRENVETVLRHLPVKTIFNPQYADNDMVHSLQTGIAVLKPDLLAALVVLGDQPQIEVETVRKIIKAFQETSQPIIVPSYNNRRGHPWLVRQRLWPDILALQPPATLRNFLNNHTRHIHYVNLNTPSILKDLDTPDDYAREHSASKK